MISDLIQPAYDSHYFPQDNETVLLTSCIIPNQFIFSSHISLVYHAVILLSLANVWRSVLDITFTGNQNGDLVRKLVKACIFFWWIYVPQADCNEELDKLICS